MSGHDVLSVHDYLVGGRPVTPASSATVIGRLRHWAAYTPAAPYLTWIPADGDPQVLSYAGLEARSRTLAHWILRRAPEVTGSTVTLLPRNDIASVLAIFAILRAGGTCQFQNPHDPVSRLREVAAAHPAVLTLRSPSTPERLAEFAEVIPEQPGPGPANDLPGDAYWSADRPAFLFGTSGSTAASKMVVQSHRALSSNAEALGRHHQLEAGTRLMGGLPIHHVNGVHFSLVAAVEHGAHTIFPERFSAFTYRGLLDTHRPHIASVVPTMLEALLTAGRGWRPPASLRYFVSAAAPLHADTARRVHDRFGVRVLQGYGLTETTNFSATLPPDLSADAYRELMLDGPVPTIGIALYGNEIEVLDGDGAILPAGQTGELCMRGHNVMDCYARRPDLTAEAFARGWFQSGDLGHWSPGPDGRRYYFITGRLKNIAKVRGEAVSLEEVERALIALDDVLDAGCVTLPHPLLGDEIVAVVRARTTDLDGFVAELRASLPDSHLPHRFVVGDVPRTTTGKIRRADLADLVAKGGPS